MMDTLQAHVLAVAHNLATYLYYNVFAPFYNIDKGEMTDGDGERRIRAKRI
jgi:hypothetical protein